MLQALAEDVAGNRTASPVVTVRVTNGPSTDYAFPSGGGVALSLAEQGTATPVTGVVAIIPVDGGIAPSGAAVIARRVGDVLVTETSVPAVVEIRSGSIYLDLDPLRTATVTISNPNDVDALIDYEFRDSMGAIALRSAITIGPNRQVLHRLDQPPFLVSTPFEGTFAFSSSAPISVSALQQTTNERNEQLIAAIPVTPLADSDTGPRTLPHIVSGAGYSTRIVLVNPTPTTLAGSVEFFSTNNVSAESAHPQELVVDGVTRTGFAYSIPPFGFIRKTIDSADLDPLQTGSARVIPQAGGRAPTSIEILFLRQAGITVSATAFAGVPHRSSSSMYVESSGSFGTVKSTRTGVAIANPSETPLTVTLDLSDLEGRLVGQVVQPVPGNGHISRFVNLLFPNLPEEFHGVLRLRAASDFAALSVRTRYNERGEFLYTMIPTSNDTEPSPPGLSRVIPLVAMGGNYATEILLFDPAGGGGSGILVVPDLATEGTVSPD
jgi:hypothetical protein